MEKEIKLLEEFMKFSGKPLKGPASWRLDPVAADMERVAEEHGYALRFWFPMGSVKDKAGKSYSIWAPKGSSMEQPKKKFINIGADFHPQDGYRVGKIG